MLIKISSTLWLNPQNVSAVVVSKQIHADGDDTANIEFTLRGGQSVQIASTIPFTEAETYLDEHVVTKLNAETSHVED